MWVQLLSMQHITESGKQVTRHPGDWVDVGRQTAELWIGQGAARVPGANGVQSILSDHSKAGVVIVGSEDAGRLKLEPYKGKLGIETGSPRLDFEKTIIWDTELHLRVELLPVGIGLLSTWDLAVPLWNYEQLAVHVGSDEEREKTKAVVRDLRVPLYDTRLVFAKRTVDTRRLFDLWQDEVEDGADDKHAFLRSLYRVKPFVLALPTTWTDPGALR